MKDRPKYNPFIEDPKFDRSGGIHPQFDAFEKGKKGLTLVQNEFESAGISTARYSSLTTVRARQSQLSPVDNIVQFPIVGWLRIVQ